jgi:hypothetical protein
VKKLHIHKEYNRSGHHTKQKQQINFSNNNDNYNNDRRIEQYDLIFNKRRKIMRTTTAITSAMDGNQTIHNNINKSCFCIGGGGGGSEYNSFENLFSDLPNN